jgi:ankyrin repeat protein
MFIFQTPLHLAALSGKGDAVEILLQSGANINEKDVKILPFGETDD